MRSELFFFQKIQQLRQTESTLHRRQAEHTAILVAKDTAQQQAEEAETKVLLFQFLHYTIHVFPCSVVWFTLGRL